MGSRMKEDERNEKIIRGLMKLPPNRRCINCNSLGPQYVCTNFWTFVCTNCSGIHREFTHRVKSVSMSKFTSQEVEALQRGGNQRSRETFLKDWDPQRNTVPDSSNVNKIRDFIKHVYVDRRYAGLRPSEKPPRDVQSYKNYEDDTRRASSYHSFSQSPPYDYQYEDRLYGKQSGSLTRKPGSDRGGYEGKLSSILCSPGRSEGDWPRHEDRFANELPGMRVGEFGSSPIHSVRDIDGQIRKITKSSENVVQNMDRSTHSQRTTSLGSFGSFDSNSLSATTVNSPNLIDIGSDAEQSALPPQIGQSPPPFGAQASTPNVPIVHEPFKATFVQPPMNTKVPSIDLFADVSHPQTSMAPVEPNLLPLSVVPPSVPVVENEGWATFDFPQQFVTPAAKENAPLVLLSGKEPSKVDHEVVSSVNANLQRPSVQNSTTQGSFPSVVDQWPSVGYNAQVPSAPTSSQSWSAFDTSKDNFSLALFENIQQKSEVQIQVKTPTPGHQDSARVSEDISKVVTLQPSINSRIPEPGVPYNGAANGSGFLPSAMAMMGQMPLQLQSKKTTNPFDLPFDSEEEADNTFLDMGSLQASLPNPPLPPAFLGGMNPTWFPQSSVPPYVGGVPQGSIGYMAGQVSNPQLQNMTPQGPVAPLGGNPFA
ncbi:hypothetical protein AMTRI_Chr01g102800 [Amborella trichopoda]